MQVFPEKYESLELTVAEKSFMRILSASFRDVDLAYYSLHINPRGQKSERINMLVLKEGIVLFQFYELKGDVAKKMIESFSIYINNDYKNEIIKKLKFSKYLLDADGELNINVKTLLVFPNESRTNLSINSNAEVMDFFGKECMFAEELRQCKSAAREYLTNILNDESKQNINEDNVNNVFQRLCPEITIPRMSVMEDSVVVNGVDLEIDSRDRAVRAYRLEKDQINIVNRITKGDQLILACAGSGKSVLMISKCFRLASLNPDEQFLITCYNKNLHYYYKWAIDVAGFRTKNVRCESFLSLCRQLLLDNNLPVPITNNKDGFDILFQTASKALKDGKIKQRFYGIFIDEIQVFKPEWYQFCFNLLKSKKSDEHFFVIAGDKSQDIANNIKKGKAPWQGGGENYPKFTGKTLPIEKNYRNTIEINDYIDRFICISKDFADSVGIDIKTDAELFLRGKSFLSGNSPVLLELDKFSNEGEIEKIYQAIKELLAKGYDPIDIAVIAYNSRGYGGSLWDDKFYNIFDTLKRKLNQNNIDYSLLKCDENGQYVTYGTRDGVTLTTINSALGLDFRAVILAGLMPIGVRNQTHTVEGLCAKVGPEYVEMKKDNFKTNINMLYTGCTRAKEDLYIILSSKKGQNVYLDMLRQAEGES